MSFGFFNWYSFIEQAIVGSIMISAFFFKTNYIGMCVKLEPVPHKVYSISRQPHREKNPDGFKSYL